MKTLYFDIDGTILLDDQNVVKSQLGSGRFEAALRKADFIDYSGDWWYVDDLAQYYMERASKANIYVENLGGRIYVPSPNGDGRDVLEWLMKTERL
jgi:hypothetical protein